VVQKKTLLHMGGVLLALVGAASPLQAARQLIPLDVELDDVSVNKVPFLIAADNGLYAKNGLAVHQLINAEAAAVARSRGVNVPAQNIAAATVAGAPITIGGGSWMIARIGTPEQVSPQRIIVSTTEGIVRDHLIAVPGITGIQDLKGKRIGVSAFGAVVHYSSLALAKKLGWDLQKDIVLVTGSANLNALRTGKADAVLASALVAGGVTSEMGLTDLGSLSTYGIPLAGSGINVEAKWLAAHRDITERFIKAAIQATARMKTDRQVFDAAVIKWFNVKDRKTLDRMYAATAEIPDKPYPAVAGIEGAMAVYDTPNMRTHSAAEFYDSSFIAKLDKSGFLDHPLK